jgi:hypothetical protein
MKNLEGVMNFSTTRNLVVKSTLILALALMPISMLAADQHKSESKGSAPHGGGHSGGQSHAGHAGQSHGGGQAHGGGAGHGAGATHENHGGEGHTAGGHQGGAAGHEGGNAGRPGNAGNRGEGGNRGNVGGNRGGVGGRGGAVAGRGGAGRAPGRSVALRGGGRASIRPNGSIRSINRNGMHISNGLHGGRTVVSERNGVRIVNRPGGGYVQHAYMNRGGHAYYSRTFYGHGGYHTGLYRGYFYHGFHYYGYYPGAWFHPGFYGWAWHPWGVPLYWGVGAWGWGGPWYGFYGGWWNPYPVYAGPAFWLTDYLIASELQSTYAAQYNTAADASQPAPSNYSDNGGGQAANGQVTLSPEVKDAIAEEVKAELAAQEQQAPTQGGASDQGSAPANNTDDNQVPPALDPARRTFVVDNTVTLISDGQECDLTGGDVLTRLTDTPDADGKVNASVSASKKGECGAGKQVLVSVDDLQEMRNHFEEQLNNGMKELASKQGTNGMPKAPDAGTVSSDIPAPQPDQNASKDLSDQQAQADQAEQQAKQDAAGQGGGGGQE